MFFHQLYKRKSAHISRNQEGRGGGRLCLIMGGGGERGGCPHNDIIKNIFKNYEKL